MTPILPIGDGKYSGESHRGWGVDVGIARGREGVVDESSPRGQRG